MFQLTEPSSGVWLVYVPYDVGFNPSTQRHYRRLLIYYLHIHSYMFRSYDHHQVEKYITTLGQLNWRQIRCFIRSHITVIVYIMLRIVDTPLLWVTFFGVYLVCTVMARRQDCQCSRACRFVTTVYYYNCHISGHYPLTSLLFKNTENGFCLRLQAEPT
jgi:hypothetical protein